MTDMGKAGTARCAGDIVRPPGAATDLRNRNMAIKYLFVCFQSLTLKQCLSVI